MHHSLPKFSLKHEKNKRKKDEQHEYLILNTKGQFLKLNINNHSRNNEGKKT